MDNKKIEEDTPLIIKKCPGLTTITIKDPTWKRLLNKKAYPSQTFDTIINNLLDKEKQGGNKKNDTKNNEMV